MSGFDNLEIGRAIGQCPLPVFTGIGHEIDQSVADIVAHTALKTPTAVADFLIEINLQFDATMTAMYQEVVSASREMLSRASSGLRQTTATMRIAPARLLGTQRTRLDQIIPNLQQFARRQVREHNKSLEHADEILVALDPQRVLKRGFSITTKDGEIMTDVRTLTSGDLIDTQLATGHFKSRVADE